MPLCIACNEEREAIDVCASCHTCTYNGCCACWTCAHCRNAFPGTTVACASCGLCPDDCHCVACPLCVNRVTATRIHGVCHNCDRCCHCGEVPPRIQHIAAPRAPMFHAAVEGTKGRKVNPSGRFIAAEIEVADIGENGMIVTQAVRKWGGGIVRDGSVIGPNPFEINTAPAAGDKYIEEVNEICKALKDANAVINNTCGLHVHVDARDFNFYDIRKLALIYEKIEPALFSIVAPSRRDSRYCKPCGPRYVKDLENNIVPKDNEKTLIKNVYGRDERIATLKGNKYEDARYSAMNIHSWIYRGTIECRIHQGTASAKKIKMWGVLWAGILDYAFENKEAYIRSIKGNSLDILKEIAPTEECKAWIASRHEFFAKKENANADLAGETDRND